MKREILFRGKNEHGDWLFGDLTGRDTIHYDTSFCDGDGNCQWWGSKVDPESVGQFTGLTDKNGKKIFEGDIILSHGQSCKFIQVVEFHNTEKTCGRGWVGVNHIKIMRIGGKEVKIKIESFSYFSFPCNYEVIGNIHDNPELL